MFKPLLVCIGLLVGGASLAAYANANETFKVDLSVSRDGVVVGQPSIQVVADRNAELTITPAGGTVDKAIRVRVSVAAADAGTVGVHLMIFDRVGGDWALRAEPVVKAKVGSDVQLTVGTQGADRDASPIGVTLKVSPAGPA